MAHYFIEKSCQENKVRHKVLSSKARGALIRYHWPGNIRELEQRVTMAILISPNNLITKKHLGLKLEDNIHYGKLKEMRALAEKEGIIKALTKTRYNITWAARDLGVDRKVLSRLMQRYGIKKSEASDE